MDLWSYNFTSKRVVTIQNMEKQKAPPYSPYCLAKESGDIQEDKLYYIEHNFQYLCDVAKWCFDFNQ